MNPLWSPDGSRIAFSSERTGPRNIYSKPASGALPEELLLDSKASKSLEDWSRDGKHLLFNSDNTTLWAFALAGDHKPFPVINGPHVQVQGRFSPDGRWIAYNSNESGRPEIFIQSFPPSAGKWQISNAGGTQPAWRGDGKELFYLEENRMMAVPIKTAGSSIEAGLPVRLFDVPRILQGRRNNYVVTADGSRFLCIQRLEDDTPSGMVLVQNWPSLLKK